MNIIFRNPGCEQSSENSKLQYGPYQDALCIFLPAGLIVFQKHGLVRGFSVHGRGLELDDL